jgi:hypothetical protein
VQTTDRRVVATLLPAADDDDSSAGGWVVGLLLAQGLYYSLRHLANAWLIAARGEAEQAAFWDTFAGLIAMQVIASLGLFVGGMMAAAGRRRGLIIGATLGVVNAVLLLGLQMSFQRPTDAMTWYGIPLLQAFIGAIGGAAGSRVWQPRPSLSPIAGDARAGNEMLTTAIPDRPVEVVVETTPWLRILLGVAIAVGGTVSARLIRHFVVVVGGGTGREMQQSVFITWEIGALAQVIGGAVAGATTRGGALYGFWVGVPAAVFLVVAQATVMATKESALVASWLMGAPVPDGSPTALIMQGVQIVVFASVGGWLGTLVMPADPRRPPPA